MPLRVQSATGKYCPAEFSRDQPNEQVDGGVVRACHEKGAKSKRKEQKTTAQGQASRPARREVCGPGCPM